MKTLDWKSVLGRHELFSSLGGDQIARLLEVSEVRDYQQGEMILREGELADSIFLIGSGVVSVVLLRKDGEKVTLFTFRGGEFFGEMAVLEQRPRSATVLAAERSTLLEIRGDNFRKLMRDHPDVEFKVLLKLSERLRYAGEQVLELKLNDVDERISAFSAKLDARLQTADAQMMAAQTVFDQTTTRANEIIESAERSRTRLTTAVSTIGGIIAVVVGLGGSISYFSLQGTFDQVKLQADEAKERLDEIKLQAEQAGRDAAKVTQARETVETLNKVESLVLEMSVSVAKKLVLPEFRVKLSKGDVPESIRYYEDIRELSPIDPPIAQFLYEIEDRMGEQDVQNDQIDYAPLFARILKEADEPEDKIHSSYLLLMNTIVNDREGIFPGETSETYIAVLSKLQDYILENKDHQITMSPEIGSLVFKNYPQDKDRFCNILSVIPSGDEEELLSFCKN